MVTGKPVGCVNKSAHGAEAARLITTGVAFVAAGSYGLETVQKKAAICDDDARIVQHGVNARAVSIKWPHVRTANRMAKRRDGYCELLC